MKKLLGHFPLLIILFSLASCSSFKDLEVKGVQSAAILSSNDTTADVAITLKISNPNKFNIIVRNYNLDAFINTKLVGSVKFDKKIFIPKKSEADYTLVLNADMAQVKKLIPGIMFSNKALLNVRGNITAKAKGLTKKIIVDREETVSRKDLEKIMVVNK